MKSETKQSCNQVSLLEEPGVSLLEPLWPPTNMQHQVDQDF